MAETLSEAVGNLDALIAEQRALGDEAEALRERLVEITERISTIQMHAFWPAQNAVIEAARQTVR